MEVAAAVEKKESETNNSSSDLSRLASSDADSKDKEAQDREQRIALDLKAGLHPLKHKFVFWYTRRTPGVRTQASYEDNIKKIVDFSTVEGFWVCYCHLARPSSLPSPTDLHLFKEGIRPLWEDSANCNGGKWIIRFKKAVSGRFWEDLVSQCCSVWLCFLHPAFFFPQYSSCRCMMIFVLHISFRYI
ncbi:eukaryotic translation initiation factor NCBP-like [Coffea arabica]|uniref:mRNA cap-binding protein n=1 Tax=Coffea arabica TaxID=13443 RepID=A0ABM4UXN9_COFAR